MIEKLPRYKRDVDKIVKYKKLSKEQIEETEKLYQKNPKHTSLRFHPIKCKLDKNRYSVTVINTSYRILLSKYEDKTVFRMLLDHDTYDRVNKKC